MQSKRREEGPGTCIPDCTYGTELNRNVDYDNCVPAELQALVKIKEYTNV
jgi:hypothetical protein